MDKLHFDLITDKRIKRVVSILGILSLEKFPLTFEELALKLSISVQTIITDIKYIQAILPDEVRVRSTRKVGVLLEVEKGFIITEYIDSISQSSLLFELITQIFNGEKHSFLVWSDKLYISEMSLKRYIKVLKEKLIEFNLSISLNPLNLIGREVDIRYFYYTYFSTASHSKFRPKPNTKHIQVYNQCIKEAEEKMSSVLNIDFRNTIFWIMIIQKRIETGHIVELEMKTINENKEIKNYFHFDQIYKKNFKNIFLIDEINQDESVFAYMVCLNNVIYKEGLLNRIGSKRTDGIMKLLTENTILSNVISALGILNSDQDRFKRLHYAYLVNMTLISEVTPLFQKNSFEIMNYIKKNHNGIFNLWLIYLKKSTLLKKLSISFIEDVCVSLTMISSLFVYNQEVKGKHILFSISGESTYNSYLADLIQIVMPRDINITLVFNSLISRKDLIDLEVDLFVYNHELYSEDIAEGGFHHFHISTIPTDTEWSLLRELIFRGSADHVSQDFYENII